MATGDGRFLQPRTSKSTASEASGRLDCATAGYSRSTRAPQLPAADSAPGAAVPGLHHDELSPPPPISRRMGSCNLPPALPALCRDQHGAMFETAAVRLLVYRCQVGSGPSVSSNTDLSLANVGSLRVQMQRQNLTCGQQFQGRVSWIGVNGRSGDPPVYWGATLIAVGWFSEISTIAIRQRGSRASIRRALMACLSNVAGDLCGDIGGWRREGVSAVRTRVRRHRIYDYPRSFPSGLCNSGIGWPDGSWKAPCPDRHRRGGRSRCGAYPH